MNVYKYAYATEENWQDKAEKKVFAKMLRKVIGIRGRSTLMKIVAGEKTEVSAAGVTDDDITPANGYFLLGRCPAFTGELRSDKGLTDKALEFRTDKNGQEWAIAKIQWTGPAVILDGVLTPVELSNLNAHDMENGKWSIPAMQFDFTAEFDSYNWDYTTTGEPEWPT
jgi:hypothetical protein